MTTAKRTKHYKTQQLIKGVADQGADRILDRHIEHCETCRTIAGNIRDAKSTIESQMEEQ